jgi:hypothetical protein
MIVLVMMLAGSCKTVPTVAFDDGIQQAAQALEKGIAEGSKVAMLNFISPSEEFSDYVIEELLLSLVSNGKVMITERKALDLIRQEMNFNLSGEVSDESAQRIGQILGAQYIITGGLVKVGAENRLRFYALNVETAVRVSAFSFNLSARDRVASALLGETPPARQPVPPQEAPKSGNPLEGVWEGEGVDDEGRIEGAFVLIFKGDHLTLYGFDGVRVTYPYKLGDTQLILEKTEWCPYTLAKGGKELTLFLDGAKVDGARIIFTKLEADGKNPLMGLWENVKAGEPWRVEFFGRYVFIFDAEGDTEYFSCDTYKYTAAGSKITLGTNLALAYYKDDEWNYTLMDAGRTMIVRGKRGNFTLTKRDAWTPPRK